MLIEREYPEIDPESADDPYPEKPLAYFLVQMDKSTSQSYNLAENFFGYNGIPTKRMELLLQKIAGMHGVFIMAVCQPTHCCDLNGYDALLHSAQKKRMRSYPAPLCTAHIVRDWKRACEEVCTDRLIQRCFMRALERNADSDIDKSFIPKQIRAWYDGSSDEESTSESES